MAFVMRNIMVRILKLLKNYENKLAFLIGNESILKLIIFIDGYEFAIFEASGERVSFNATFQNFVEIKEGLIGNTGLRWAEILQNNRSEEEALKLFYVYLDEFCTGDKGTV